MLRGIGRHWFAVLGVATTLLGCRGNGGGPSEPAERDATAINDVTTHDATRDRGDAAVPPGPDAPSTDGQDDKYPCGASIWSPVPGGEDCGLFVADVSKWCFPRRDWKPCGEGCSVAIAGTAPSLNGVLSGNASAAYFQGALWSRFSEIKTLFSDMVLVSRVLDGLPVTAVLSTKENRQCYTLATHGHTPFLIPKNVGSSVLAGHAMPDGRLVWQAGLLPAPSIPHSIFDAFDSSGFWGITFDDGSIVMASAADSVWTTVESSGAASNRSAARKALALYTRWAPAISKNILKAATKGTNSTEELVVGPDNVLTVAMSDDVVAWIGVDGPAWRDGTYASVRTYWSPIGRTAAEMTIAKGPILPITSVGSTVDVAGDWMALEGCGRTSDGATDCRVIVVQRSTQQAYFLRAPSGVVWTLLALAPDQVLLGETDIAKQAGPLVERLALIRSDSYARWHAPL